MRHLRSLSRRARPALGVSTDVVLTVILQFIAAVQKLINAKDPSAEGEGEGEGEGESEGEGSA